MNNSKFVHIALILFNSLTLTHAGFVDYRSGAEEIRSLHTSSNTSDNGTVKQSQTQASQPFYLQSRKFVELQSLFRDISDACRGKPWRGLIRAEWTRNGLCCGVFDLLVKMSGGKTRIKLLNALFSPRNKLQLSREVGVDWKAVDRHIDKLLFYGLIAELAVAGTCRVFIITEKGKRALMLSEREGVLVKKEDGQTKLRQPIQV